MTTDQLAASRSTLDHGARLCYYRGATWAKAHTAGPTR